MLPFLSGILANVAFLAVPSPLAKLAERTRPNPYAPKIPDQIELAGAQQLRGGLTGRSGSEAEYASDQGVSTIGYVPALQDVTTYRRAPSWFALDRGVHGDPGADRSDPTTLADVDRRPQGNLAPWGGNTRNVQNGSKVVLRSTLLEPTYKAPTARQMADARAIDPKERHDALDGAWSD